MADLHQPATQQTIASIIGVGQPAVSSMIERGIMRRGDTLAGCIGDYCAHLREIAAGRASESGGLDLVQERARLAAAQADRVELQNKVTRGDYAPIDVLGECLAKLAEMMVASLDQIDGAMSKSAPDLPEPTRLAVLACVVDARNKIVRGVERGLVAGGIDPDDDIDAEDAAA